MTFRSLRSAVAFLTVLPVGLPGGEQAERLGRAYFPAVGALVGLAAGCVFMVASKLTSPLPAALVAVATGALLTGGLHLDGLADFADGMFGGHDPERRLEIMHDPRVGSFAVVALTLVLVGDVAALSVMTAARALVGLIAAGALSRFSMLVLVALLPYARPLGLGSAAQGEHRVLDLVVGGALTVIACALDWRRALVAALLVGLTTAIIGLVARRRLGGGTGDVYGACAEVGQLVALLGFAAL